MYLAYEEVLRLLENLTREATSKNLSQLSDSRSYFFSLFGKTKRQSPSIHTYDRKLLSEIQENILKLLESAKLESQQVLYIREIKDKLCDISSKINNESSSIETIPTELLNITAMLRSNFRETKYYGQSWLLNRMSALGYLISSEGACFGIASMAFQALLVNDIETFNNRLNTIENLPISAFYNDFEELKQKRVQCIAEGNIKEADIIQANIVDIKAFFDGISLHQSPEIHDDFLADNIKTNIQNLEKTSLLTRPTKLGTIDHHLKIQSFVGAYDQNELESYLNCLKNNLGQHSFSLMLSCDQHAILVSYNESSKKWLFINPNDLPGVEYIHADLLARAILNCYGHANGLSMGTDIYVNPHDYEVAYEEFLILMQQPEWIRLHSVSIEKIEQAQEYEKEKEGDIHSQSLLDLAIKQKDIKWIQQAMHFLYISDAAQSRLLSNAPIEVINFVFETFKLSDDYSIEKALINAIKQNELEVIRVLINKIDYPSFDSLNLAFSRNRTDIFQMLLDKVDDGVLEMVCAHLNSSSSDLSLLKFLLERFTPDNSTLNFVCGSRNVEAVKLILAHLDHPQLSKEQCHELFKYKFDVTQKSAVCDLFLNSIPFEYQKEILDHLQSDFKDEIAQKIKLKTNVGETTQSYRSELNQLPGELDEETSHKCTPGIK